MANNVNISSPLISTSNNSWGLGIEDRKFVVYIIQDNIPQKILSSMGISNAQNISAEHFTMPIDMVLKTIFIQ